MSTPLSSDVKVRLLLSPQMIEAERQRRRAAFVTLFADAGPLRRELYQKHLEFFQAGAQYKERLYMAANRVGKTVAGAFEATCHLTGRYLSWWQGKRFEGATDGWACGTNSQTTRDVVQGVLARQVSRARHDPYRSDRAYGCRARDHGFDRDGVGAARLREELEARLQNLRTGP
jgi:hypothetical protein